MKRPTLIDDFEIDRAYESPPHVVTKEESVEFARRYDPQPFHLDEVAAQASTFGGLVCGGFQTAAMAWALALKSRMFDDCSLAGIGIESLGWHLPVKPGDIVRCRFALVSWRPSQSRPGTAVARIRYELINDGDQAVLTMLMLQLVRCRVPPPSARS